TRTGLGRAAGTRGALVTAGRAGTRTTRTRTGLGRGLCRAHTGGVGRERVVTGARTGRTRTRLRATTAIALVTALVTTLRTPALRTGLGRVGTRSLTTGTLRSRLGRAGTRGLALSGGLGRRPRLGAGLGRGARLGAGLGCLGRGAGLGCLGGRTGLGARFGSRPALLGVLLLAAVVGPVVESFLQASHDR